MREKVSQAQKFLKEAGWDGWLLYDFHGNNEHARRFLSIPSSQMTTRRFFYWIPAQGEPIKIVHAIEAHVLDHCPGKTHTYLSWQSLNEELAKVLKEAKTIAMEYSPQNAIPYISRVDGGTIEQIRSFGSHVVSSGDFLSHFTAVLSKKQIESQQRAAIACDQIAQDTWQWIADCLKKNCSITEYDAQQKICEFFEKKNLVTDHFPIVGVNAHSADPHYEPQKTGSSAIRPGDFILIDLWAKEKDREAVFADITRVAVAAQEPTQKQSQIFHIVRKAQQAAVKLVKERFAKKMRIEGWEVDDAARSVIDNAGYGRFFIHRTGHSIETALHGSGAHMDNLEMHDVRPLLAGTCFSIEPGIYLPGEFGVRLEFDVLIDLDGKVEVTGGEQNAIVCLLSR